ncbi:alpha/beta-hydrolase [Basidiobolus meristosporus CBS 931.73]|uniref:Alpha/beta-hydrolase n=1 Tax=Basidiobolus meristosporus CBS 931.73 TaxID=1314790 RepID=A0A1Y1YYJ0_9FUNG|nr:alpha/beta-hydrolase [Basidiobolus meristosporus CBS 931.73]|eukprot:ORY03091.1 alpha/beta-hydrolase [Basidiobolus meristosporus CBS 931.73]
MSSWETIRQQIRAFRASIPSPCLSTMKDFVFDDRCNCIYFIGTDPRRNFSAATLFSVPLPPELAKSPQRNHNTDSKGPEVPVLKWKHMLLGTNLGSATTKTSTEEGTAKERTSVGDITWYLHERASGRLYFPHMENLYFSEVRRDKSFQPSAIFQYSKHIPRMDPKIGGRNRDLIAYVRHRDIWVSTLSGYEMQLTFCGDSDDLGTSCGIPEFVMQEEFDRFSGFFWAPFASTCSDSLERILYLRVNEANVEHVRLSHSTDSEELRYPRAGTPNAVSDIQIVEFAHPNETFESNISQKRLWGKATLKEMFPWMEYIIRLGWLPHGKGIWVQVLDRRQLHTAVVKIPLSNFCTMHEYSRDFDYDQCIQHVEILYEEEAKIGWINHTVAFHFLESSNENHTEFIWSSERSGYRHLYYIKKHRLDMHWVIRPLTHGEWPVADLPLTVDIHRKLVYFTARRDTPLESHLYVTSFMATASPHHIIRLTPLGYSHDITMDPSCSRFVTLYSSLSEPPRCSIYCLTWKDKSIFPKANVCASVQSLGSNTEANLPVGNLFSFVNRGGTRIHGCYYQPDDYVEGQKYPALLHVYGGPKGQVVTNTYKCPQFLRMFLATRLGFVVVMIDGRGSSERGLEFEAHIRWKMGTIELDDQVDGLHHLLKSQDKPMIDTDKIAISGWSYGGYLSLLALVRYPDVFKIAIAGAPVTDWMLYDTAYTERYMGIPEENPSGYREASVLNHVKKFPDTDHRLLLAHGLIDENVHFTHVELLVDALSRSQKPYQLQIYPNEGHGIRHPETNEHFETLMFYWLKNFM